MSSQSNPVIDASFKAITDASSDIIHLNDEQGNILYVNRACKKLLGYSENELLHTPAFDLIHDDDLAPIKEDMQAIAPDKVPPAREIRIKKKDGGYLDVEVQGFLVPIEERKLIGAVIRDISARKAREEQKIYLNKKKLESVGVLAGGIAHDFNNILAAILGNIELAELYTDSNNKAYPLLKEAKNASIRAKDLTQQLLTFAKGGEPVKQTSSISKIITDSADFVLHGSSVVCDYHIPNDLWPVDVDTSQISQVIQNMIINACHAMPNGGLIEIYCNNVQDISKELSSLPPRQYIKITIVDSGSGIPQKHVDKIFDPYFSTKQDGSGLGLAICHSIICKHSGNISVQSEINKGTTFTIYLPASPQISVETGTSKHSIVEPEQKSTIMVMDDKSIVRNMVKQMLSHSGHEVLMVENGHEAIGLYNEYVKSNRIIDVIIMDLTIPGGMGGKETVLEILKINPDAKVVVASGYSNDPIMANYQKHGFIASIAKPFQLYELNKLINAILG
jgi:PAS domain S-box-containing protein